MRWVEEVGVGVGVVLEVAGWLLLLLAVAGILLNFAMTRRAPRQPHAATRKVVIACMIAGGMMLAVAYASAASGLTDTLMDAGRRGGSLWVPAVIFALVAAGGVRAWQRGHPET